MRFLVIICVSFVVLSMIAPLASAASTHGCAPSTPPQLTGTSANAPATYQSLFINEVLSTPNSTWNCSELGALSNDYSKDAWIEIYNPQDQAFDLYAARAYLDSGPGSRTYFLPLGSDIAAHGFLVIFPNANQSFYDKTTTTLRLLLGGTVIDQVTLPPQIPPDTSYARVTDGSVNWQTCELPTIDASNAPPLALTPSPAPTQTPVPTSTPTRTPTRVSSGSSGSGGWVDTGPGKSPVSGKQPLWSALQLPTDTSSPPAGASTRTATRVADPASASDTTDISRKFLLTLLTTALALALLWCWRLFRAT